MKSFALILCFTFIQTACGQQSDFDEINFQKADSIAKIYKGEALFNLPVLARQLTTNLDTEAARFRAIYYWVTHNISGEYYLMSKNDQYRELYKNNPKALARWNAEAKKKVFHKLLHQKETLCTGYAYLIKQLSNIVGLECEIIYGIDPTNTVKFDGNDTTPNHTWNAVKLNGKWYLCDATWSTGYIDLTTFLFVFDYEDSFFLMEPSEFAKKHKPVDDRWNLLPASSSVNQ